MRYEKRIARLRQNVEGLHLDALLITHLPNARYLCGFTGSAGVLVVTRTRNVFFTDGRYTQQARAETHGARVMIGSQPPIIAAGQWLAGNCRKLDLKTIGIEGEHLTVAERDKLAKTLSRRIRIRETTAVGEELRMIKDTDEITKMRAAARLGGNLFNCLLQVIRPGVKENEVAAELEYAARMAGAEAMSFETIIASGERSALPHGRASLAAIPRKGFVVCDFGVILAGYCSDMTRTVHVGVPNRESRAAYNILRAAQETAVQAVKPGVHVSEVDQAARNMLKKNGLARYFTHSTGHGVGLEIHEPPKIGSGQKTILEPGMVITIEPGVYIAGKWGIRIEDMVVVTDRGCEILTPTTKELVTV
jgi:Xaa-Pro aminopeptidase